MSELSSPVPRPGPAALLPAFGLALFSAIALAVLQLQPSDRPGDQVAIVFAPGTSLTEAVRHVAQADGLVVRTGAFANIVVAVGSAPGFIDQIKGRGAWLVVDPRGLGACFAPSGVPWTGRNA